MKKLFKLCINIGLLGICSLLKAPVSLENMPEAKVQEILSYVQMPPLVNRFLSPISLQAHQEISQKYQENPALLCDVMHAMDVGHGIAWILDNCAESLSYDYSILKNIKKELGKIFGKNEADMMSEEFKATLTGMLPIVMKQMLLYLRGKYRQSKKLPVRSHQFSVF